MKIRTARKMNTTARWNVSFWSRFAFYISLSLPAFFASTSLSLLEYLQKNVDPVRTDGGIRSKSCHSCWEQEQKELYLFSDETRLQKKFKFETRGTKSRARVAFVSWNKMGMELAQQWDQDEKIEVHAECMWRGEFRWSNIRITDWPRCKLVQWKPQSGFVLSMLLLWYSHLLACVTA